MSDGVLRRSTDIKHPPRHPLLYIPPSLPPITNPFPPNHSQCKDAIKRAEGILLPWLKGTNANPLLYDTTWGGLVLQSGLSNPYANFGNTYYNDHHFQYGYLAYTAAVIAKFDPGGWCALPLRLGLSLSISLCVCVCLSLYMYYIIYPPSLCHSPLTPFIPPPPPLGFVATHGPKLRAIVEDIANDDDANPAFPLG